MKTSFMVFVVLSLLGIAACMAGSQRRAHRSEEEHETIKRTLEFSGGSGTKLLEVDAISGSIHVTGYDGRTVEMTATKTIHADSPEKIQTAKQEVKLDIADKADTIRIYVDQPGHEHSTTS